MREQRKRSGREVWSRRLGSSLGDAVCSLMPVDHVLLVRAEKNERLSDLSYPDFWHHSSEGLRRVLAHQVWQVDDHAGSLDVLPGADHDTETTWRKVSFWRKKKYSR